MFDMFLGPYRVKEARWKTKGFCKAIKQLQRQLLAVLHEFCGCACKARASSLVWYFILGRMEADRKAFLLISSASGRPDLQAGVEVE